MNGKEKTFEILGSQETDPGSGRISHISPLGEILIGKKAGETVTLKRDGREIPCEIISVK
jgi:transcription elongation GreA/GreB family factor